MILVINIGSRPEQTLEDFPVAAASLINAATSRRIRTNDTSIMVGKPNSLCNLTLKNPENADGSDFRRLWAFARVIEILQEWMDRLLDSQPPPNYIHEIRKLAEGRDIPDPPTERPASYAQTVVYATSWLLGREITLKPGLCAADISMNLMCLVFDKAEA